MTRLIPVLLVLLCQFTARTQDHSVRVLFESDGRETIVGAFGRDGTLFASLNDLAATFGLGVYENEAASKLELIGAGSRLKVTGDNPFVVVTDATGRRSVHQLPSRVLHVAGSYFVPLGPLLPMLSPVTGRTCSFDPDNATIIVKGPPLFSTFDITSVSFEPKANGMVIRIHATRPLPDFESWLRQDGWLYVTIADARADTQAINRVKPEGLLRRIVTVQSPTSVQLTFRLSGRIASSEILRDEASHDILVSIRRPGDEDEALLEKRKVEIQEGLKVQRDRWKLDVIVIDAGHGGHDPGTIGVGRTREKDITLKISLKLGKLLEQQMKDVRVVYTRKTDRFVELDRRGQIANENNGKLFISIHCNSLKRKPSPTRGFEVYLLRPGRTQEAIEIAERENAVIELEEGYKERYQELTEENFILVTMAQSAYLKASEVFADILQQEMEDHLAIPNRGIRQAGFYVLVGASMPNVLVETAYLSNREDERFLNSEAGQNQIAQAMVEAIKRYKDKYEVLLEEGRDMGVR
jgi:N-acetylmuramoyl-L-alanine amidase